MKTPPLTDDEKRIEALRQYDVFEAPAEAAFDHLTRLAARCCEAPIAFLCFVGRNRQCFRSMVGLDLKDTDPHLAFCYHAILQPELLVVPDASRDPRFAGTSLVVSAPHLRFYASAPLITPEGHAIGCLAVMAPVARELTAEQAEMLRALAVQAMALLEARRESRGWQQGPGSTEGSRKSPAGNAPLFQQSHVAQLVIDPASLAVVEVNPAACRFFHASAGELRSRPLPALLAAEMAPQAAAAAVEQARFQFRHRQPTGDVREIEVYASPVDFHGRNLRHLLLHDVTERTRLEDELKSVLTHARCILWAADVQEHRDRFHWWQRVSDLDAAMQVLPLELKPGQHYAQVWAESRHPEDQKRIDATGTAALRAGLSSYSQEFRCFNRYGEIRWLYEDVWLQRCEPGRWRAVGVCTDVTERKQAEAERARLIQEQAARAEAEAGQQRLQFLLETSTLLSATLDSAQALENLAEQIAGHLADICLIDLREDDRTIHRVAGRHADPAMQARVRDLLWPEALAGTGPIARVLRTGRPEQLLSLEDAGIGDEAQRRLARELGCGAFLAVAMLFRGQVLGSIALISTDPDRCFSAADQQLAEDVAHRAAIAVENARLFRQIQKADRAKDDFLAMLGHELRNPLGPLLNALAIQRQQADAQTLTRTQAMMERQLRHMARLVDDLLDVSRIARGKIELRKAPLDFRRLVCDTVEDHRRTLEEAGLTLTLALPETPIPLEGDPVRLSQVLGNLLQNAAKFTDPGGHVTVEVFRRSGVQAFGPARIEQEHEHDSNARTPERLNAVVVVRDTGIGIGPGMLPRVFEPFAQAAGGLARSRGGLGLGLALVKGWVELHGGGVQVRSAGLGKGAAFTFWLPVAPLSAARPETPAVSPPAKSLSVLIIEDNADAASTLQDLLELSGHHVTVAATGAAGLELARQRSPEVVLCDIGLPGMDGYAVARALRQEPATAAACLIALSGYGRDEDRRRAEAAGFDYHLTKPADLEALQRLLHAGCRSGSGVPAAGAAGHQNPPAAECGE